MKIGTTLQYDIDYQGLFNHRPTIANEHQLNGMQIMCNTIFIRIGNFCWK